MKLKKIQIRDFINHPHSLVEFGNTTFFVGPNGAGKSSIRNGIEWSLLNSCRGMKDKSGNPTRKGEVNLIRRDQKKAEVILNLTSGKNVVEVTRSRTKSGQTLSVDVNGVPIPELPKVDELALAMVLDSKVAIGLDAAGRKAMFQKYLMPDSTNLISAHLVHEGLDDSTSKALAAQIIKESLEVVHGNISKRRLECDRSIKEMLPIEVPTQVIQLPSGAKVDLVEVSLEDEKVALQKVEADGERLITAKADYQNVTSLLKSGEQEITDLKAQLARIDEDLAAIEDIKALDAEQDEVSKSLNAATAKRDKVTEDYDRLVAGQSAARMRLAALNSHDSVNCQFCEKPLTKTDKGLLVDLITSEISGNVKTISHAGDAKITARNKIDPIYVRLTNCRDKINTAKNTRIRLEAQQEPLARTLAAKEAAFKKAGEHNLDPVSDNDIQDLRTKQIDLRETIIKKNGYDTQLRQNKAHTDQKASLTAKRGSWDDMAKILHPKTGSMAALIQKPLDELKDEINKIAHQMNFSFVLREDYEIEYNGIIHSFLSDSEQYRVGVMLQIAVAKIANTGIVALDYADTLVSTERGRLMLMATKLQSEFETILVFSATERSKTQIKESFEGSGFEGTAVYWVENGTVDKLI